MNKSSQILSFCAEYVIIRKNEGRSESAPGQVNSGSGTGALFWEAGESMPAKKGKERTLEELRKDWGAGSENRPYTEADYAELERMFGIYAERLMASGGPDAQQEYILRLCSRLNLDMNRYLNEGQIEKAQKLNKMIQDNLASENLRKKDEQPLEEFRIDGIIDALEKHGYVKDGKILPLKEVQRRLLEELGALGGEPSHKYAYTMDAADQMIQIIVNTMRANDGLPEYTGRNEGMTLDGNVAAEFAAQPNKNELKAYMGLQLTRSRRDGNKTNR